MAAKYTKRCTKTMFDRIILCSGTMTDYMSIKKREQQGTSPDPDDTSATEKFTTVENYMGYIEAIKPTARYDGVHIDSTITHIAYIPFDQTTYELDLNTLFVDLERQRNRFFKLKRIMNYGEQDEYLALSLTETGFTDLQAAEG